MELEIVFLILPVSGQWLPGEWGCSQGGQWWRWLSRPGEEAGAPSCQYWGNLRPWDRCRSHLWRLSIHILADTSCSQKSNHSHLSGTEPMYRFYPSSFIWCKYSFITSYIWSSRYLILSLISTEGNRRETPHVTMEIKKVKNKTLFLHAAYLRMSDRLEYLYSERRREDQLFSPLSRHSSSQSRLCSLSQGGKFTWKQFQINK